MTEGVFDDFVRVRWGDLEPAARLVVLDPDLAREVTTAALARLRSEWGEAESGGRPVEQARRLVLTAALSRVAPSPVGRRMRRGRPAPVPDDAARALDGPSSSDLDVAAPHDDAAAIAGVDHDGFDPVVGSLVERVRSLDPVDRALLAGRHLWDAGPDEVAHLLDRSFHELRERERALDRLLAAAHTAARGAAGPAEWALGRDLDEALDAVVEGTSDPPDPAELVGARARRVRRRTVVVAGAAALAVGGVGAAVALRPRPTPPATVALPGPTDRSWLITSTWATRGPLSDDPALRTFRTRRLAPADRVLWAGDAGTRRLVVVLAHAMEAFPEQSGIRLFSGARGSDLLGLGELSLPYGMETGADAVALMLPDSPEQRADRMILFLLTMPTIVHGSYSLVGRPTADGQVRRTWVDVPMEGGAGAAVVDATSVLMMRARVGTFDGRPIMPEVGFSPYDGLFGSDPVELSAVETFISDATGIPRSWLESEVRTDAVPGGALFDNTALPGPPVEATVTTMTTRTPDGAHLRTTTYRDERSGSVTLQLAELLPAAAVDDPWLTMVNEASPGVSRFLVVHPTAATVQVIGAGGDAGPGSDRVPTRGRRATVVELENVGEYGEFRVVLRDRAGRITYDAVPTRGTWLLDG